MLDSIIKETSSYPAAAAIWMHGLGADGHDFADIIPDLHLPANTGMRFIFPHAPIMPIGINNGYEMRAWYDITDMDLGKNPDIDGIERNSKLVAKLVDEQIEKGIAPEKILLIGFSQGGVMALHTATRYPKKLAGAVSLSSYFPTANTMPLDGMNSKIPVFFGYGSFDNVVTPNLSEKAFEFLKANGNPIEKHSYPMMHSVCVEELEALGKWITFLYSFK